MAAIIRLPFTQRSICNFLLGHTFSPVNFTSRLSKIGLRPSIADMADRPHGSCPQNPPFDTNKRTEFGRLGCTAYGYPSSGGTLIKEVDVVDMQFLQLDRFSAARRSSDMAQEDEFCTRMRKIGVTWWADEQVWIDVQCGIRERTELESRQLIFGWPTNREGVWVLRYDSEWEVPRDFGKVFMALNMDERCQVMKHFGATFYADPETVNELIHGTK